MSHVPNAEHIVWRYVEASWRYELRDTTNFAYSKKLASISSKGHDKKFILTEKLTSC